jgi:phosphoglycerate dehydrogenase-like enzyme
VKPRVTVAPHVADWARDAIIDGGGEVVDADDHPDGLIWAQLRAAAQLRDFLGTHPDIGWVQLPFAGVEDVVAEGLIDHRRQWTSAKGAYAEPVAEHALMLTLACLRRPDPSGPRVVVGRTGRRDPLRPTGDDRRRRRHHVLPARHCSEPFRAPVTVVRQHPEPVAGAVRTLGVDQLHEGLRGARVVVLALALTPKTRGLISGDELRTMGSESYLVNVGRGALVDTDALVTALTSNTIAGAALDVTDPEPLPTGHALWALDNCLITPHTADTEEMIWPLLARRVRENVRRMAAGEALEGLVDPDLGY